jgi:hypothetical protein
MKLRIIGAFIVLSISAFAQATVQEWQAKAVEKYPELGVAGSPFNKRFLDAYRERQKADANFLKNPRWPLFLADEIAAQMHSKPSEPEVLPSGGIVSRTEPLMPVGVIYWAAGGIGVIILFGTVSTVRKSMRRKYLVQKYGDPEIVDMIMRKMFWTNQTKEQLVQ